MATLMRARAAVAVVLLVTAIAGACGSSDDDEPAGASEAETTTTSEPGSAPSDGSTVQLPFDAGDVTVTDAGIWSFPLVDPWAYRIDPASMEIDKQVRLAGFSTAALTGDGMLWFVTEAGGVVWNRLDPATGEIVATVEGAPPTSSSISVVAFDKVWIGSGDGVHTIDTTTNVATKLDATSGPSTVTATDEWVWFLSLASGLQQVDPATSEVLSAWRPIEVLGEVPMMMTSAGDDLLFVTSTKIARVDPLEHSLVAEAPFPEGLRAVTPSRAEPAQPTSHQWWFFDDQAGVPLDQAIAEDARGYLVQIDLETMTLGEPIETPHAQDTATASDGVWVSVRHQPRVQRIDS